MSEHPNVHPLLLILGAFSFLICLLIVKDWPGVGFMALLGGVACFSLRVGFSAFYKSALKLWPLIALTLFVHTIVSSRVMARFDGWPSVDMSIAGLNIAALFTSRLILIILAGNALYQLYAPQQFTRAIGRALSSLPFGRRSLAQANLTVSMAMRFIPAMERESGRLLMAFKARGIPHQHGLRGRLSHYRRILLTLFVNSLRNAEHVSAALEVRGYDPSIRRTALYQPKLGFGHALISLLFITACVVCTRL